MPGYKPIESPDQTTVFSYHDLEPPRLPDIFEAKNRISRYLPTTPLVKSEYLSEKLDAEVFLKREDTLPTGAFKVRGGINLCSQLNKEFYDPGLIAASTGNHGQSIAFAGREFDIPVHIAVPENPNEDKVAAMEQLGAEVHQHGRDYDGAREWAETQAVEHGYRYVHSANEPALIAGVGTAGLEVMNTLPSVDTVFCPVGGGSSASGYCLTVGGLADVIGVQSENAKAMYHAWDEDHLDPKDQANTSAEGLQSRVPFALTTWILRDHLHDMAIVSDEQIREAVETMLFEEHLLLEGAACAPVAAAVERRDELTGKTVVIQLSGRNLSADKIRNIIKE